MNFSFLLRQVKKAYEYLVRMETSLQQIIDIILAQLYSSMFPEPS